MEVLKKRYGKSTAKDSETVAELLKEYQDEKKN